MIAFSRSMPNRWSEHDHLAKTAGGFGIPRGCARHRYRATAAGAETCRFIAFCLRAKDIRRSLAAAELEVMNLTGDGNGFDIVTMPHEMRARVPTSNFFQQAGLCETRCTTDAVVAQSRRRH
jgi:hypothetical protein